MISTLCMYAGRQRRTGTVNEESNTLIIKGSHGSTHMQGQAGAVKNDKEIYVTLRRTITRRALDGRGQAR